MLRETGRRCGSASAWVVTLAIAWAAALPAQAQETVGNGEPTVDVIVYPKRNESVLQTPSGPIRVREPGLRTHENLYPFAYRSEEGSIPTRGLEDRAVDVIYHVTLDYGGSSAIRTRSAVGQRSFQPLITHRAAEAPNGSRIRYHGGFR